MKINLISFLNQFIIKRDRSSGDMAMKRERKYICEIRNNNPSNEKNKLRNTNNTFLTSPRVQKRKHLRNTTENPI